MPYFFPLMKEKSYFLPLGCSSTVNCIPVMMAENIPSKKEFQIFLLVKTCALYTLGE